MHGTTMLTARTTPVADRVPGHLVHKRDSGEVLLASWLRPADEEFLIDAAWPRQHTFYAPQQGHFDPLLAIEAVRQSIPLISHAGYGAAKDDRQSWQSLRYSLNASALAIPEQDERIPVLMHAVCTPGRRRSTRLAGLTMSVALRRGDTSIGSVHTAFHNHSLPLYHRLRGGTYADLEATTKRAAANPLPQPCTPATVGRAHHADVVLSPTATPRKNRLRIDLDHPILFDHPVDHAPGMLLLEAARQAAHTVAGPRPMVAVAMDVAFNRYTELDVPCWIRTDPLHIGPQGRPRFLVTATQNENTTFVAIVTMEPVPGT
ncbi:ScbA/BarX family gamma-butyrolactone biosynthesis protein [Streptomyces sp. BBFR51]|uniref:ScbA/BarX family gamma-butyrolactone biosynthesis protein n=1 Tax=Streptomyces sp. BBFR51 TaxID=3372856 RepID=UPI0037DD763A